MADEIIFQLKFETDEASLGAFEKKIEKRIETLRKKFDTLSKDINKAMSSVDIEKTARQVKKVSDEIKNANFKKLQEEFRKIAMEGEIVNNGFARMIEQVEKSMRVEPTFLQNLAKALGLVNDAAKKFYSDGLEKMKDKLFEAAKKFIDLEENIKGFGRSIGKAFDLAISAVTGFVSALKTAASIGITFAKDVGKGILKFGADSVKTYQSFQDVLVVAQRTMGLTKEETDALGRSMRELALDIRGATAEELQSIAGIAGNLGINFKDGEENLKDFVKAISRIGSATDLTVEQAAAKIPAMLAQYRVATDEMGSKTKEFGDVLNVLGNNMNATQSQILKVAESLSGTAATSGVTVDKMLALSAAVASIDKKFGTAGGNVSQILNKLVADSGTWAETLGLDAENLLQTIRDNPVQAFQMVIDKLSELQETEHVDVFQKKIEELGLRGFRTSEEMKKLVLAKDELGKALELISNEMAVQNSLQDEANIAASTFSMLWKSAKNAIDEVYRVIGKPLLEALSAILDKSIIPMIQGFAKWLLNSEAVKVALDAVNEGLTAIINEEIAPLVDEFIEWLTTSESIESFLRDGIPAGMQKIRLGILSVIGHFKDFRAHLFDGKTLMEALILTFPELESSAGNIESIIEGFKTFWQLIKDVTAAVQESGIQWRDVFDGIIIVIDTVVNSLKDMVDIAKGIGEFFSRQATDVSPGILGQDAGMWGDWAKSVKGGQDAVEDLTKSIDVANDKQNKFGEDGYGNSVWPDTEMWVGRNEEQVDALAGAIGDTTRTMNSLGDMAGTVTSQITDQMQQTAQAVNAVSSASISSFGPTAGTRQVNMANLEERNQFLRQQQATPASAQAEPVSRTSGLSRGAASTGEGSVTTGVNINFNGQNIVDESSKNRFVRQTITGIRRLGSRIVVAE